MKAKMVSRMMTNICSNNLLESKSFYLKLFNFKVSFESNWFIHLVFEDNQFELGIIDRTYETVPLGFQKEPQGLFITFIVDNVDEVYELAKTRKIEIICKPTDTPYGQRRLLLKDPDNTLIDISSLIPNFKF